MTDIHLSRDLSARLRGELQIILGNADLISADIRSHPIISAKARSIARAISNIQDLLIVGAAESSVHYPPEEAGIEPASGDTHSQILTSGRSSDVGSNER